MGSWWGKSLGWKWSDPDLPAIYSHIYSGDAVTKKLDYKLTILLCTLRDNFFTLPFFDFISRHVLGRG